MPRAKATNGARAKVLEQNHLIWEQTGALPDNQLDSWEPRPQEFVDALLAVLATGSVVLLRPGSGGRAIGIAIWEGDTRHPAKWLYDQDELDAWADGINRIAAARGAGKTTE